MSPAGDPRLADQLTAGVAALGLALPADAPARLLAYVGLLVKWNRTYNLTAVREADRIIAYHLLDSLAILPWLGDGALADIGSGGGLPGVPLAIARPDLAVTVADANTKKGAFLRQTTIELGLANVRVQIGRVEDWHPAAPFAQISSRAFAELADFIAVTRHLLAPGGRWLAMKGMHPGDEITRLPAGVVVEDVHPLTVAGVTGERHLVVLREA